MVRKAVLGAAVAGAFVVGGLAGTQQASAGTAMYLEVGPYSGVWACEGGRLHFDSTSGCYWAIDRNHPPGWYFIIYS